MFERQNRIIIVDDRQDELDTLVSAFLENGIGCRPLLYENTYDEPLSNIRVAFFDINIGDKKVDDTGKTLEEIEKLNSGVYHDLAIAINQYISKANGAFALIFWTKNMKVIDGFKKYMRNPERGFSDSPSPMFIGCIDKDEVLISKENLSIKLLEVLNNEAIKFLFDFEQKATVAGEKTINKIYDIVPKDNHWGETKMFYENLGQIFSKIAVSTLGFKNSKQNPSKALYEGLLPIMNNELIAIESDIKWEKILKPLYECNHQKEIIFPNENIQRKVNTIFHIDTKSSVYIDTRGAVFEYNFDIPFNQNVFFSLCPYFSKVEEEMNRRFQTFLSFKQNVPEDIKSKIKGNSRFVVIELSAACDYSQNKNRNNKYILGLLTPIIDKDILDLEKSSNSLYYKDLPDFIYEENELSLWINLNYLISDFEISKNIGKPLFVLKKEVMDLIGNRYANHVSRIGITSF